MRCGVSYSWVGEKKVGEKKNEVDLVLKKCCVGGVVYGGE